MLEIDKLILKFIWKCKGHRVAKTIWKKNEVWSLENSYCYFIMFTQKLQKSRRYRIDIMIDIYRIIEENGDLRDTSTYLTEEIATDRSLK